MTVMGEKEVRILNLVEMSRELWKTLDGPPQLPPRSFRLHFAQQYGTQRLAGAAKAEHVTWVVKEVEYLHTQKAIQQGQSDR